MRASLLTRAVGAAALLFVASVATAAPVTLNFQGRVTGYDFIDLSAYMPVGDSVSLSLTFEDTFSDGTYSFADDLGPVTGAMTVGASTFTFDGVVPYSYQFDGASQLTSVTPRFTGTGPAFGNGALFGLFMSIAPDLTLVGNLSLGYGFTTAYGDGFSVTNYGYALITPERYSFSAASVPEPSTFALLAFGAVLTLAHRRRRTSIALH